MRQLTVILLWLLIAFPAIAHKKAILIGVSDYPAGSGWCKLNAHNDVTLLEKMLSPDWDVTVLEDKTKKKILKKLAGIAKKNFAKEAGP